MQEVESLINNFFICPNFSHLMNHLKTIISSAVSTVVISVPAWCLVEKITKIFPDTDIEVELYCFCETKMGRELILHTRNICIPSSFACIYLFFFCTPFTDNRASGVLSHQLHNRHLKKHKHTTSSRQDVVIIRQSTRSQH